MEIAAAAQMPSATARKRVTFTDPSSSSRRDLQIQNIIHLPECAICDHAATSRKEMRLCAGHVIRIRRLAALAAFAASTAAPAFRVAWLRRLRLF
jgi:hypothetical protein